MTHHAAAFGLAADLQRARDSLMRLFGEHYDAKMGPWRELVRGLMRQWNCDAIAVLPRLESDCTLAEVPALLVAACVDVAEGRQ